MATGVNHRVRLPPNIIFRAWYFALLGTRAPVALKVFLLAVAIIDDLGAVVIIAVFYTSDLAQPLPLGIAAGLVLDKQIGVFSATWIAVKTGLARLPEGVGWTHVYGVACLTGVGFTMSLFIGSLAFGADETMNAVRLGVISGSVVSGLLGYALLRAAGTKPNETASTSQP